MLRYLAHNMYEIGLSLNWDGRNKFLGRAQ